ncbi:TetR/AcrR family transcriptional regulator [Paenibacillus sp.]|uniref:TetR/AcrR family transcriptional regulator n=1 Tax=Paenibacillus sp. TaxID=58172 RepID=UPI00282E677E|nr:TetR/AcrR family transcriptional regulator [Paenibacillus sp.]MDR0270497.1 TetR/AcrR family transcriptional regulator [Paenibacillus sp.]
MQLSREDWIKAGLRKLAHSGIDAVRVEVLARELKISKGSFYHHFQDRSDLLESMIDYWEEYATRNIIDELEVQSSPSLERILKVSFAPNEENKQIEFAIYAWAKRSPELSIRIAEIENQRISYVAKLYEQRGLKPSAALSRAKLAYLVYLGWMTRFEAKADFDMESTLNILLNA